MSSLDDVLSSTMNIINERWYRKKILKLCAMISK